jgi:8-oxo-dGTP pyrophosphatase MutT (NUDIX family)
MKAVIKVVMFVYRQHNKQNQFFVLRRKGGDNVILTGHVGDHIHNETLEDAARREVKEELGVDCLSITDLDYSVTVTLEKHDKTSEEHAFLIEIPDQYVYFLEGDEPHSWHSFSELKDILTYDSQKGALTKIKAVLN